MNPFSHQNIGRKRRGIARRVVLLLTFVTALSGAALFGVTTAPAQSPSPGTFMEDSRPGVGFPSGASAVVVEGVGVLGSCADGTTYSESQVDSWTVSWINQSKKTFTEITPQTTCGTLSAYESLVSRIESYVEAHASNPGTYWGGFMFDEEPGYGFSASSLESLNTYTENLMVNTSGVSWYATEDQPNGWVLSTYNSILETSWPAPQGYTSSMVSAINSECSTYGECTNLVTVDSAAGSPWNSPSYVTGQVNGAPWSIWSGNWYNLWRPE